MRIQALLRIGTVVTVILFAAGCAATSGAVFSSIVSAESEQADDSDSDAIVSGPVSNEEGSDPALEVTSTPSGATVYLDFRRVGRTPLELTDIVPDRYRLRIEADGYYAAERTIVIEPDTRLVLDIELEPIVGFLDLDLSPRDAAVFVDGEPSESFSELPVGSRRVRVERFGYTAETRTVTILEDQVTRVSVALEEAAFDILEASADRTVFSPDNPGVLGRVTLAYRVSAPGGGGLEVVSPAGRVVYRVPVGPFSTWQQEVRWDGTDAAGVQVADGRYELRLVLSGDDGRERSRTFTAEIDSTRLVRYRSVWGSVPGLIYSPAGPPLPAAQFQLTTQTAGIITVLENELVTRFPTRLALRAGTGGGVELSALAGFTAGSAPIATRWNFGGSAAWSTRPTQIASGIATAIGASVSGIYSTPFADGSFAGPDTHGSPTGFGIALPATLTFGPVNMVVAPEYRLSPAPVWYGNGSRPSNAWTSLGYLRFGVVADISDVTFGTSLLLRSELVPEGVAVQTPINAAAEAHWVIPETPFALSFFLASEIESASSFYVMSGVGLGFLF